MAPTKDCLWPTLVGGAPAQKYIRHQLSASAGSRWAVFGHSVLACLARSACEASGNYPVSVGLLNVRSISCKGPLVYDLLDGHKVDFLCLIETWQHQNDFT